MSSSGPAVAPGQSGAYLLDSSVLIRSLRGDIAISARIFHAPQVYVSSIVLGELYFGAYGSPTRPDAVVADVETVERTIATLPPDAATARIYAQVKQDLKRRGLTIPDNNLWIAATALQYDVTLAARRALRLGHWLARRAVVRLAVSDKLAPHVDRRRTPWMPGCSPSSASRRSSPSRPDLTWR